MLLFIVADANTIIVASASLLGDNSETRSSLRAGGHASNDNMKSLINGCVEENWGCC